MSKRNSAEAKRAARERLLAERAKQDRRARIRRRLVVGGAAVALLGVAGGIGVTIARMGGSDDNTDWGALRSPLDDGAGGAGAEVAPDPPPNTSGGDQLTLRVGDPDPAHTPPPFQ